MFKLSFTTDLTSIRERIAGAKQRVPVLNGETRAYINFDNATSTPALLDVVKNVDALMDWYAGASDAVGFKSRITAQAYDDARTIITQFVGANPREHIVIFGKNGSEANNTLAQCLRLREEDIILTSLLEPHSNDLPWRGVASVDRVAVNALGELDEADFERKLEQHKGHVKLVAISGASILTGDLPFIHRLAEKAHAAGAHILVDAALLAARRPLSIGALNDPAHLDYVSISAHRMYAPYGTGALIARRDTFEQCDPDFNSTPEFVTHESVEWAELPQRDEPGTPNIVGVVALATALRTLEAIGLSVIADHEIELTAYTLGRLRTVKDIQIYGNSNLDSANRRLGIIPINIKDMPHSLVAAILSVEFGIGVRSGLFDAHPYAMYLLDLPSQVTKDHGLVRISFGMYNTAEEVDVLIDALQRIARGRYYGRYQQDAETGEFRALDWNPDPRRYFRI